MDESRIERHCPDPGCDWKVIEATRPADLTGLPPVGWQGSLHATLAESVIQVALERARIVEVACETHIREMHDAEDPIGWAERTMAENRARKQAAVGHEPVG